MDSRSETQLNNISNTLGATPATDRYSRVENQVKGIMDKIGIEEETTDRFSRIENMLADIEENVSPGGDVEVVEKDITENGTYTAPEGYAYSPVTVTVSQAKPIDISTSAGMTEALTADNVGKAFRYIGATDTTYTNGDIYVVEEAVS